MGEMVGKLEGNGLEIGEQSKPNVRNLEGKWEEIVPEMGEKHRIWERKKKKRGGNREGN